MNLRVVLLSVLVAASTAAAWYLSSNEQNATVSPASTLLEGLPQNSDAIEYVKIENATNVVFEARRQEGQWRAVHLDDSLSFPVDTKALSTLIRRIAHASVVEKKTDNPALYSRLGVEGLEADAAESMLLTLEDGDRQWQVILGNTSTRRHGQFVRQPEAPVSYLIDKVLTVPLSAAEWLKPDILSVSTEELSSIRFWQAEKPELLISRTETAGTAEPAADNQRAWQAGIINDEQVTPVNDNDLNYPSVLSQAIDDIFAFTYLQATPFSQAAWEANELAGKVDMTLNDNTRVLVEISQSNELGQYYIHFEMPDSPSWVSDWVFTVSGYQGRAFLLSEKSIIAGDNAS